ncbi:hypothetical protein JCM8547_006238, partial [Rhodosporidiobolus lusitaniae]
MSSSARHTSRLGSDASALACDSASRPVQATAKAQNSLNRPERASLSSFRRPRCTRKPSKPPSSLTSATSAPQVTQSYVSFTDLGFAAPFDLNEPVVALPEQDVDSTGESDE